MIDREFSKNDFTDEGLQLVSLKEGAWLRSKASQKSPPDTKVLAKALAEIRAST